MRESVRVQNLRVGALGYRGIPFVQSVIEDALRTEISAAGPAAARGLLVIRRIDFGSVTTRHDALALKRRLANILYEASHRARIPQANEEVDDDAVFFPHPMAPYLEVVKAIAYGRPTPRSWPYRAVLGETLFADADRIVEEILKRQLELTQAGPALRQILRALGPRLPQALSRLSPRLLATIARELGATRLQQDTVGTSPSPHGIRSLALDLDRLLGSPHCEAILAAPCNADREQCVVRLMVALAIGGDHQRVSAQRVARVTDTIARLGHAAGGKATQAGALRKLSRRLHQADQIRQSAPNTATGGEQAPEWDELLPPATTEECSAAGANVTPRVDAPSHERPLEEFLLREEKDEGIQTSRWTGFEPSAHAGLAYAIVLLSRLFAGWINHPDHLANATGRTLLARILLREPPHPEDPAWLFIQSIEEQPLGEAHVGPLAFDLTAHGLPRSTLPLRISRVTGFPSWRMLTRGRVVLALWQGRAVPSLRLALLEAERIERTGPQAFDRNATLTSCEIVLRHALRSDTGLRMGQLLHRSGMIAAAPTDLDIAFDASVIDLAVRRRALDISPGWCEWLWRVVTIHYDFGGGNAA